jgi:nitroreductase
MNLYDLMKNRRSNRHFFSKKIPEDSLKRILEAGQYAPSGADKHPYAYIIIEDQVIKEDIKMHCEIIDKKFYNNSETRFKEWMKKRRISPEKDFLVDAPILIIVAGEIDKPYWLESTWISITYVILAAEYEGLGTLTYTPSETGFLKEILVLPEKIEPVVIIPIGYIKKRIFKKENKTHITNL